MGPSRFKDLGSGIITFDNSDGVMRASLVTNGQIYFTGSRIGELHLSNAALAVFVGLYRSTELDATYNLSITKGSLMLRNKWNPTLELIPIAQDEFYGGDFGTVVFHRDAGHRISGLSVFSLDARDVGFEKVN